MDQTNQGYRILEGDEANFFAAEENHHSLDAATAAAVAQAVGPNAVQHGLEGLNNSLLDTHPPNVNPEIPGLKTDASPPHKQQQQHHHAPPPPPQPQLPTQLPTTTNSHQQQQPQHTTGGAAGGNNSVITAPDDMAQALAANAMQQPPAIQTGKASFFACPVRHCQFLGKKIPEIQRHMGRNQHKGINNRTLANYSDEQAYVPAAMQNTAMVVDRVYKLAVCRNGSFILSKNEIPAHSKLCEMCQGFDESLTNQPDYQEIANEVDLEPFKRVQQDYQQTTVEPNYEDGMLRRIAGTYRDDNEDNDKRFLCVYCYQEGKLFTMGRKDGNHLYNVHSINPDNRASAWVPCRGMSYRLLGKGFCDQSKFYVAVKSEPPAGQ